MLDNDTAEIERARLEIRPLLAWGGVTAKAINRFEVVFEELVVNVMRYGFTPGSEQKILTQVGLESGVIVLVIEDDGVPFDPTAQPEPPPLTSLETAQIGGLGIPTVRKFSKRFVYERAPVGGDSRERVGAAFHPVNRVTVEIDARS